MSIMLALLEAASPGGGLALERGWQLSNAIELPDLRAFYYINMFLDNSISSPNMTLPKNSIQVSFIRSPQSEMVTRGRSDSHSFLLPPTQDSESSQDKERSIIERESMACGILVELQFAHLVSKQTKLELHLGTWVAIKCMGKC